MLNFEVMHVKFWKNCPTEWPSAKFASIESSVDRITSSQIVYSTKMCNFLGHFGNFPSVFLKFEVMHANFPENEMSRFILFPNSVLALGYDPVIYLQLFNCNMGLTKLILLSETRQFFCYNFWLHTTTTFILISFEK